MFKRWLNLGLWDLIISHFDRWNAWVLLLLIFVWFYFCTTWHVCFPSFIPVYVHQKSGLIILSHHIFCYTTLHKNLQVYISIDCGYILGSKTNQVELKFGLLAQMENSQAIIPHQSCWYDFSEDTIQFKILLGSALLTFQTLYRKYFGIH